MIPIDGLSSGWRSKSSAAARSKRCPFYIPFSSPQAGYPARSPGDSPAADRPGWDRDDRERRRTLAGREPLDRREGTTREGPSYAKPLGEVEAGRGLIN